VASPLIEPLLNREALARTLSVSLRTLDRLQASGRLPKPDLVLGPRMPRWRNETIRRWLDDQSKK
jgi:predicted DNA-binding transcriptional regulator AlpA